MRTTSRILTAVPLLALAAGAPAAHADLEMPDYPNARESTCQAEFSGGEAWCTVTVIGRYFAVGARGSGVVRASLQGESSMPGMPAEDLAACSIMSAFDSCVGATAYDAAPYAIGTQVTCVAVGMGDAKFECSSFDVREQ